MIGEYNTQRPDIILKEYGRNVQKLAEYIRNLPDINKRTELSHALIELMKQLTPSLKDQPEDPQRMWDDLYIVADFNLDINSPYPKPERDILFKKPDRVEYPQSNVRFKHYGKNIERLIKEAMKIENPQEQEDAVIYLGKLMKTFYSNWNKETLDDSVIVKDIREMSNGKLVLNIDKVREDNLFEKLYRDRKKMKPVQNGASERSEQRSERDRGHRHQKQFKNKNRRRRDNG